MLTFGKAHPGEKERIFALCASCLNTSADYFAARDAHDPYLLQDERIVAREGGRVVSNITLFEFPLSFGCARVKAGGIADVATNPAYRGQGSASELLRRAHAAMLSRGLSLAVLGTDIHPFYERIGYVTWEMNGFRLLDLSPPATSSESRPIELSRDLPLLSELNAATLVGSVGTLIRSRELWLAQPRWFRIFPGLDPDFSIISRDGEAFLRAMYNSAQCRATIMDYGAKPGACEALRDLAATILSKMSKRGAKSIWLPGYCRGLADALAPGFRARELAPNRHLMLKILDWPGLLRSLRPELESRAGPKPSGSIALHYQDQAATIKLAGGRAEIQKGAPAGLPYARLEPARWIEVLLGSRPFSTQPFAHESRLGERDINMLDTLFPKRDGLFWEADFF